MPSSSSPRRSAATSSASSSPRRRAAAPRASGDSSARVVERADALAWLGAKADGSLGHIVTSLPDLHEVGTTNATAYAEWMEKACRLCLRKAAADAYVIFYQTDRKLDGQWIDKSAVVARAARAEGVPMRWHKVALRRDPPSTIDVLRPTYTHLLCYSRKGRPGRPAPDVIAAGRPVYPFGMGLHAADFLLRFVRAQGGPTTVVDPFVGRGTVVAAANAHGLRGVGVDKSASQCQHARRLRLRIADGTLVVAAS